MTLDAEAPYRLPFVTRSPLDNSFFVEANVANDGFPLLNLLTPQVAWQSGRGEAKFRIAGNWLQSLNIPIPSELSGFVRLREATVAFSALPEPLTNINGTIRLDSTPLAIVVDDLTGNFSNGELMARGSFPILGNRRSQTAEASDDDASQPASQVPLTVNLNNIALNLKGLYNGKVDGRIAVGGSLLESLSPLEVSGPELRGNIDLNDGTVTIPEGRSDTEETAEIPIRFGGLRISLKDNIEIVQGAYLDVQGRGDLILNGTLASLRPEGTIRLPSGRVGLFGAALGLAGVEDRAEFNPALAFDPLLDITLEASLPDNTDGPGIEATNSPFPRNEIPDTTIENLGLAQQGNRLVRITARYQGVASELGDFAAIRRNLELTSSPLRSENEIIALLSGNVIGAINALEGEGNATGGLATFAGSALFSSIRDFVGNTGPVNDFRIFQVTESSGQVNESQDIGAEIGFDVTSNISVSILKVLTNDTPYQFNTRYRISDQFTLRGTTSFEDFQDRTGALLEYESRF